ncbi:uncharacterized protein LOC117182520 [Belonocnema kinseyi]|uniref:uncharacterized protein LOC117182520 n=1 Tax=Belonocnema kinseyi TaxID=2817044 RepID=UPI00143D293E|nr:uncharacterized protein LOC117182520 [Belonocnema kinseyi]
MSPPCVRPSCVPAICVAIDCAYVCSSDDAGCGRIHTHASEYTIIVQAHCYLRQLWKMPKSSMSRVRRHPAPASIPSNLHEENERFTAARIKQRVFDSSGSKLRRSNLFTWDAQ